jgi:hypothetical protein
MSLVCPHCQAPQGAARFEHGRVHCTACDKWYRVERPKGNGLLYVDPPPRPAPPPRAMRLDTPTRELPAGMVGMGFKLIEYDDGTMFAVSASWGCTDRLADLEQVVEQARKLVKFMRYVNKKRLGEQGHDLTTSS